MILLFYFGQDLENMSISMDKSMMKSTDSDATLLDLSQSTLNFILDEQQHASAAKTDGGPSVVGAAGLPTATVAGHIDVDATLIAPSTEPSTNKDKHNSISIIDISDTSLGDEIIAISSSSEGIFIIIYFLCFVCGFCVIFEVILPGLWAEKKSTSHTFGDVKSSVLQFRRKIRGGDNMAH